MFFFQLKTSDAVVSSMAQGNAHKRTLAFGTTKHCARFRCTLVLIVHSSVHQHLDCWFLFHFVSSFRRAAMAFCGKLLVILLLFRFSLQRQQKRRCHRHYCVDGRGRGRGRCGDRATFFVI